MNATTGLLHRPMPLPVPLTPLLGREHESTELLALLSEGSSRLVTIIGPGGVGKTRLALHVASLLLAEFNDDITFVPLASIREPAQVLPTIVQSFGVFSDTPDASEKQLYDILHDQRLLLVLDNFEQVLGAGPFLARVLARCPRLVILVTSQGPLNIDGEQLFPLAPLPLPDSNASHAIEILASDAVSLFVQRARAVKPQLVIDDSVATTIAGICRRLDGLPLAIELAAARVNILSPDALLARLSNRLKVLGGDRRDVPDRLRTMRNAIAWSYDLLGAEEQALFRRMTVFVGGISLDAVETICEPVASGRDPFDLLGTLVDHSLVRASPVPSGDARFLILETIRDYGLEQLALLGEEDDACLAHATCMQKLSEDAEPHLTGSGQKEWIDRLDPDTENIRAAVDWSLAHGHEEIALRIGASNWRFCSIRGLASDCLDRLEQALAAPTSTSSPYRASALVGAGWLAEDLHDLARAESSFEQARQLAIASGNKQDECHALIGLGAVAHDQGDYATALAWHEQTASLAREIGDRRSSAMALSNMAAVFYYQGILNDAERCWGESVAILEQMGDTTAQATGLSNLGSVAFERGDLDRAERMQRRALQLQRTLNTSRDLTYTLINLGELLYLRENFTESRDCFDEAISLLRAQENPHVEAIALNGYARLALAQGNTVRAASMLVESLSLLTDANDPLVIIDNTELLAAICAAQHQHAHAIELLTAAARQRSALGADPTPRKVAEISAIESTATKALQARAVAQAQAAGAQLDADAMTRRVSILAREIAGRQWTPAAPPSEIPDDPSVLSVQSLTNRERDVLQLLAQGLSTAEISDTLCISPRTTTTHITNILGKLGVTSRTAAVAHAIRIGIV